MAPLVSDLGWLQAESQSQSTSPASLFRRHPHPIGGRGEHEHETPTPSTRNLFLSWHRRVRASEGVAPLSLSLKSCWSPSVSSPSLPDPRPQPWMRRKVRTSLSLPRIPALFSVSVSGEQDVVGIDSEASGLWMVVRGCQWAASSHFISSPSSRLCSASS